jgi:hypothetical protein
MFTRIVKMKFEAEHIPQFLTNFEAIKHKIRNFEGCMYLELYRDKDDDTIFFTYSRWNEVSSLEAYRNSELFGGVWKETKPMFAAKAEAWSVDTVETVRNEK